MWRHLPTATPRWAYFIWLAEGVATILCAKLVFMLFTISLKRIKMLYLVLLGKWQLKKGKVNPMSTEWIVLVRSIKYVVTITKEFTYSSSAHQTTRAVVGNHRAATRCRSVKGSLPGRILFQVCSAIRLSFFSQKRYWKSGLVDLSQL